MKNIFHIRVNTNVEYIVESVYFFYTLLWNIIVFELIV